MSTLEQLAVQRVLDQAKAAGIDAGTLHDYIQHGGSTAARIWDELHPDDDRAPCCYGSIHGQIGCTCWTPVWEHEQQPVCPPQRPEDLQAQRRMCGDCAYRKDSPERSNKLTEEQLLELAEAGTPFWCHQGMRRAARWVHPDGRELPGQPDDWQPPMRAGIPYRLDGQPGLLCAGWSTRAKHAAERGS